MPSMGARSETEMANPPHEPTDQLRNVAKTAAGFGLPHEMIATLVGISENTLRLYYAAELKQGKAQACFQVAKTLFDRATTGKDLGAAIFFLKSQAGFREKHVLDDPLARQGLADLIALSGLTADAAPVDPQPPQLLS
jgi:hypothetical protein